MVDGGGVVGLAVTDRGLAEHIEREGHSAVAKAADVGDGLAGIGAGDEAGGHRIGPTPDNPPHHAAEETVRIIEAHCEPQWGRHVHSARIEVLPQMVGDIRLVTKMGERFGEAEKLRLQVRVARDPLHHGPLPPGALPEMWLGGSGVLE